MEIQKKPYEILHPDRLKLVVKSKWKNKYEQYFFGSKMYFQQ